MRPEEEKKMDIINVNKKSKNSTYTLSVPLLFIFQKKKTKKTCSIYITQNMQTDLHFITKSVGGCTVYKELSFNVFTTGRTFILRL